MHYNKKVKLLTENITNLECVIMSTCDELHMITGHDSDWLLMSSHTSISHQSYRLIISKCPATITKVSATASTVT